MILAIIISAIAGLVVGGVGMYLIGKNARTVKKALGIGGLSAVTLLGGIYGVSKINPETGVLEQLPVAPGAKIDTVLIENWMPKELLRPDHPMPLDSGNTYGFFAIRNDTVFAGVIGTAHFSYNMTLKATPNRLNEKGIRGK